MGMTQSHTHPPVALQESSLTKATLDAPAQSQQQVQQQARPMAMTERQAQAPVALQESSLTWATPAAQQQPQPRRHHSRSSPQP